MNRKTVDSILKGVAGVSLAFGGVSVLSDANLVYASEVEQPEETTQEESSSEVTPSGEDATKDDSSVTDPAEDSGSAQTAESDFEAVREAYIASQPKDTCTMSTVADAMMKAAEEAQTDADDSVVTSDSTDVDASESDNVSEGEDTTQALEESNTDQGQTESSEEDQASDAKSERIKELEGLIKKAQDNVDSKVDNAQNGKIDANYYRAADELVKLMIEYSALTEGEGFDGTIEFNNGYSTNKWVSNGIDHNSNFKQNYLETTYKDTLGEILDIIYYDYVNADAEGGILTGTTNENKADLIDHIVVYEKAPVFAVDDENGSFTFDKDGNFIGTNDSFTFVRDEFRNITAYIIDGQKIEVKVDDNGKRYIVDSKNEDGSVVTTTVIGNNASGYTVTKTTFVTNADGETEQTSKSEKLYKVLKGFSSGDKGKGEVYKKDLVKEDNGGTETPQPETPSPEPSTPETPQPETPSPEPSAPEAPQSETQETEIADEDVPLSDVADVIDEDTDLDDEQDADEQDEDLTDLEDEEVPLAVLDLDEPVDIPDEDVPLSENPETGDAMTATWLGTAAASVAGLFGASRKKRKG
ncbi:MAG: hypothetical protein ACI4EE_08500 [Lachnospiraceae bacterium]